VLRLLPSLFVPYDDDHGLAADHARVVADQLSRVYYGAQRQWCDEHGLALTGHPSAPDELTALDHFSWPGQDAVWRWVLPGPTALHGRESATARTAASAASARGIRTVLTEALGAYGWRLTMDEAKWLLDWHLVRGTTTFVLHAFFESVRGNRAFESEPDLGLHNAWWPHLDALTAHLRRAVMVLGSLTPTAEVAVVVPDDRAPVEEVAVLYEHQVTFDYLTPQQWRTVGDRYRVTTVIPAATIDPIWDEIREAGPARVLDPAGPAWWTELTDEQVRVREGRREDLRLGRWRDAEDRDWLMLVNEGEQSLSVDLGDRTGELWDLWTGQRWQVDGPYELGRRCSVVVAPAGASSTPPAVRATPAGLPPGPLGLTSWQAHRGDGQAWTGPAIGDWTTVADLETWSGSVRYRSVVELAEAPSDPLVLDLGTVGDLARVWVNGEVVADLAWAPYRSEVPATCWRSGENVVEVLVSNSSANAYEGAMRPSGLIGPVTLG
ncbi:MAG TPA: hypothetical protein IAA98_00345, partial [Candidatus Avipropionibacterium avicola]|nr:hypothetical protein [Candidatus Avipropionibacterium avicola]